MKKILVPVDFSDHSEYALEVAATLAKKHNLELVVLHMMGLSQAIISKENSKEVMEAMYYIKLAQNRFEDFLKQPYLEGLKIETTVQNYKEFHEIDSVAKEFNCGLIVMGSHGSSGLKEVFVGSNTEKVVRNSTTPVLVIKNKIKDFKLEKVLFASNFEEECIGVLKRAREFFDFFNTKFKIIIVNTPNEGFRSTKETTLKINAFLKATHLDTYLDKDQVVIYNAYSVEEGVFEYSSISESKVIAMPTHGRKGLAHFFSGSISEDLVNHSKLPVITFKI